MAQWFRALDLVSSLQSSVIPLLASVGTCTYVHTHRHINMHSKKKKKTQLLKKYPLRTSCLENNFVYLIRCCDKSGRKKTVLILKNVKSHIVLTLIYLLAQIKMAHSDELL